MDDDSHAFVLKIWQEERDLTEAAPIRRGSLEDVQTGDCAYFGSLQELCALLSERTGMAAPAPLTRLPGARRRLKTLPQPE